MISGIMPQPFAFILLLMALLSGVALASHQQVIVLRVPARYDSIRLLVAALRKAAQNARLGEPEIFACRLALDEACVNIIEHAYTNQGGGEIEVTMQGTPGVCVIRLTDFGQPYDPTLIPAPEFTVELDEAKPGGLGLFLMKALMDEVQYVVGSGRNSLVMVKRRTFQT